MATFIETKVKYDKMMDNGLVKKVNEPFLVDALSFTEAEARIIKERTPYISGEFSVSAVKKSNISEIFFDENGDLFYRAKVNLVSLDERTGVEKRSAIHILVQASDFKSAYDNLVKGMEGTISDYEIASLTETAIVEVYLAEKLAE